jgi:hypothetical protein
MDDIKDSMFFFIDSIVNNPSVIGNASTQLNVEGKCLLVILNVRENRSGNQK